MKSPVRYVGEKAAEAGTSLARFMKKHGLIGDEEDTEEDQGKKRVKK